jgi:4-hydroxy-2-oxoheptanedioate aldolase
VPYLSSEKIMRKSKVLARLRSGGIVRTCLLGHYIPAFVCHAARAGYDCIWLDLEHRLISDSQVQALLAYAHLHDIDIMVRSRTLGQTGLCRYLEEGAAGLMVPFVSTADKARMLVQAVKFPPLGDRGLDNGGLDADYQLHDVNTYAAWANRETFLCVQIETPEAVHNIEAIAAVKGVDVIFVGPADLGLRLRQSGEMTLDEAWQKVAVACAKHGVAFGGPAMAADEFQRRRDLGARMLVACSEFKTWSRGLVEDMRKFEQTELHATGLNGGPVR